MALADRRTKDIAMAAALKDSADHNGQAVQARKRRRFRQFMAQFSGKLTGSAAHRRRQVRE